MVFGNAEKESGYGKMSKVISMSLNRDLYEMLNELATLNGVSVQTLMRNATIDWLLSVQQGEDE